MAIRIIKLKHEGSNFYSPLSGKPAFGKDGANTRDRDLLFLYVGEVCEWAHVSKEVLEVVKTSGKELDDLTPAALCRRLTIPGAVCLEVDSGWNGVNWAAWRAPARD